MSKVAAERIVREHKVHTVGRQFNEGRESRYIFVLNRETLVCFLCNKAWAVSKEYNLWQPRILGNKRGQLCHQENYLKIPRIKKPICNKMGSVQAKRQSKSDLIVYLIETDFDYSNKEEYIFNTFIKPQCSGKTSQGTFEL